jgi:hypothetical protein
MEAAVIAVAAIIVIATAALKLAATINHKCQQQSKPEKVDHLLICAHYPDRGGVAIDDGLPGQGFTPEWTDEARATIEPAAKSAVSACSAFLRIADSLCELMPEAKPALENNSRAVAIATIVASGAPLLYPEETCGDVYHTWYWKMAMIYYEPSVDKTLAPPPFKPIKLIPALQQVTAEMTV